MTQVRRLTRPLCGRSGFCKSTQKIPGLAACRLVLLTRRAVACRPEEEVPGFAGAAVWGLVRSAQSEHPDCSIVLVDIDDSDASRQLLPAALGCHEPELVLREGRVFVPRLCPVRPSDALFHLQRPPGGSKPARN